MVRDGVLGLLSYPVIIFEGVGGDVELGLEFGPVTGRARIGSVCVGARKGVGSERLGEGLLFRSHCFSDDARIFSISLKACLLTRS